MEAFHSYKLRYKIYSIFNMLSSPPTLLFPISLLLSLFLTSANRFVHFQVNGNLRSVDVLKQPSSLSPSTILNLGATLDDVRMFILRICLVHNLVNGYKQGKESRMVRAGTLKPLAGHLIFNNCYIVGRGLQLIHIQISGRRRDKGG